MAVKTYKGAKAKADKLFSLLIRSVGYCEHCNKTPEESQHQCAHIISRRYSATRTDLRNAFCLCAGCHRYFTDYPREFSHFISDTWASKYYDQVLAKSKDRDIKVDWLERVTFLQEIQQNITDGEMTLQDAREYELDKE